MCNTKTLKAFTLDMRGISNREIIAYSTRSIRLIQTALHQELPHGFAPRETPASNWLLQNMDQVNFARPWSEHFRQSGWATAKSG
jgi:hypothetical protein